MRWLTFLGLVAVLLAGCADAGRIGGVGARSCNPNGDLEQRKACDQ
ncbi:MAG: hypothetical protein M3Y55_01425 [Pseudomonadota bacterium]|nr:hypothetical protein [Pseudomonadota bacterium]